MDALFLEYWSRVGLLFTRIQPEEEKNVTLSSSQTWNFFLMFAITIYVI